MEYANWFVVVMGIGIVFFGLIVLIVAVTIMGKVLGYRVSSETTEGASEGNALPSGASVLPGGDAQGDLVRLDRDVVAAIAAAIADDMGTDVSKVRINAIRKVA